MSLRSCVTRPAVCSSQPSTKQARSANAAVKPSLKRAAQTCERRSVILGFGIGLVMNPITDLFPAQVSAKESIFVGEYNDPSHPGCRRSIDGQGRVYGADPVPIKPGAPCRPGDQTTPWELQAEFSKDDKTIAIDFDPIDEVKQGPVTGRWTGEGLQLPNGLWTKK